MQTLSFLFFKLLPKNCLSYFFGKLMDVRLPSPILSFLIKAFAYFFSVDLNNASKEINEYKSIGDFFIRELKPGLRLVGGGLVSPIDGVLRDFGQILSCMIPQVKGIGYSIEELLRDSQKARAFDKGFYFNLYLSPKNYHHVHAPLSGQIVESRYIPGTLWPVNDWAISNVPGLFCQNERIITYIDSELGQIAVVMVGAFNVGRISLSYDSFESNDFFGEISKTALQRSYERGIEIKAGQKLGTFHMGSTVVLMFPESSKLDLATIAFSAGSELQYGQTLFHVRN